MRRDALVGFASPSRAKNAGKAPPPGVEGASRFRSSEDDSDPREARDDDDDAKPSSEKLVRWAHVVCAQCVPGVRIEEPRGAGGEGAFDPSSSVGAVIRGLDAVPDSAFEGTCACRRSEAPSPRAATPGAR